MTPDLPLPLGTSFITADAAIRVIAVSRLEGQTLRGDYPRLAYIGIQSG